MGSSLSPTVFWRNAPPKLTSFAPFPCLTSQDQGPGPFIEPRCAYALRLHFLNEFEVVPLTADRGFESLSLQRRVLANPAKLRGRTFATDPRTSPIRYRCGARCRRYVRSGTKLGHHPLNCGLPSNIQSRKPKGGATTSMV